MTDDIHELQRIVYEQQREIERLTLEKVELDMLCKDQETEIENNDDQKDKYWQKLSEQSQRIQELEADKKFYADLYTTEHNKHADDVWRLCERIAKLEEALREAKAHIDLEGGGDELVEKFESLLTNKP